jgi:hypothetical protein
MRDFRLLQAKPLRAQSFGAGLILTPKHTIINQLGHPPRAGYGATEWESVRASVRACACC